MKTINHSIIFFGAALLVAAGLTACSADIDQEQRQDLVPVQLTACSQDAAVTLAEPNSRRASNNLYTSASGFDGGESVKVWMNSTESSSTYTISTSDKTTLQGGTLYYPVGTTGNASIFALYPTESASSHTVAYNQHDDAAYKLSDLMYATLSVPLANKTVAQSLSFHHQLLKLHVSVAKGEGVSAITSVKMKNVKRTVTVTPATSSVTIGTATAATDGNGDEIILFSGSSTDAVQDYACVFPKQSWSGEDFIEIIADGQTATYQLTRSEWTAGSSYTLTLNVNAASLGSTVSISNWTDGGNATVNSGGGDLTIADIADETYNGTAKTPTPVVKYGNTTLTKDTDYELTYRGNTNAGTATVIAIGIGSYQGKVGVKDFTIQKAAPTYTAPTATTPTYNSSAQNLVTAGSTSHGTITYSTSENGDYSTTIPQGTNAGSYHVWWKLTGDANHNDVAATQVTGVSIQKANCTVSLSTTSLTIAPGSNSTFTVTRPGDGVITATSSNTSIANTSVSGTTVTVNKVATGTATITVTVAAGTNHNAYTASDKVVTVTSTAAPVLGDAYYSDGTWGNNAHAAGATVIGVVAWLGSDSDLKCGKSHGLVMALTDANSSVAWGPTSTDETFLTNVSSIDGCKTNNKNGLTNTASLVGDSHTHGAASAADSYTPVAPTSAGATKWFLPSAAQWIAVLGSNGLGGYTGTFVWGNYATSSTGVITNINNFLTASGVGGTGLTNGATYWSSSEYGANAAVLVVFNSSGGVNVDYYRKSYTYRVRAFLAF